MSQRSQPAACACGQVLFEVADRKVGDMLSCPWCQREYRFLGENRIEPYDPKKKPAVEPTGAKPDSPGKSPDAAAQPKAEGAAGLAVVRIPAAPQSTGRKATENLSHVSAGLNDSRRAAPAGKPSRPKEVPGGLFTMIGFIVVFNAAALIALSFVLPRLPDGTRESFWGSAIPKTAVWPEILALVIGHIAGFIAWSCYVYRLWKLKKLAKPQP